LNNQFLIILSQILLWFYFLLLQGDATAYRPSPIYATARNLIYEDVLYTISSWRDRFADCELILAGDFNTNLNTGNDRTAEIINNFTQSVRLYRCDDLFPDQKYQLTLI